MNDKDILKIIISEGIKAPPSGDFDQKVMQSIKAYSIIMPSSPITAFRVTPALLWILVITVLMLNGLFIIRSYYDSLDVNEMVTFFTAILTGRDSLILFAISIGIAFLVLVDRFFDRKFRGLQ